MLDVKIRDYTIRTLIDSDCIGNFIDFNTTSIMKLHVQRKKHPYTLYRFDDRPITDNGGKVIYETLPIPV
jgi:hypothetical protein